MPAPQTDRRIQHSLALPLSLVARVDQLAVAERRSRSAMASLLIERGLHAAEAADHTNPAHAPSREIRERP